MLRAIENMGIEMSFGIIFIGNGELSKKDYARFIEKHKLSEEYIQQSTSFLTSMREMLQYVKNTTQYKKYLSRYEYMVKLKTIDKEDLFNDINLHFHDRNFIFFIALQQASKNKMNPPDHKHFRGNVRVLRQHRPDHGHVEGRHRQTPSHDEGGHPD